MNDLSLLDRFGPSASPLSDDVLDRARERLATRWSRPVETPPRRRRLPLLAAAAAAAVGLAVTPALLGSDDSIALASVDPLTFPVTATWLPSGLGDPTISRDGRDLQWARYGTSRDHVSVISAGTQGFDHWWDGDTESRAATLHEVDVNGVPGRAMRLEAGEFTIAWEQPDGDVIGVTGTGRWSDPAVVERVADSVVDRPQPVDLFLTIAPAGWQVFGYQSDHHISYGPDGELAITLLDGLARNLDDYGARDTREVTIDSRRGLLGRQVDEAGKTTAWVLVTTAPDGQAFSLQAPPTLTEGQVIEVADGVRHR